MDDSLFWAAVSIMFGLIALVLGGELLVRGASLLATAMRISPLVIGLTVVAFGTSAPELGVSLQASLSGAADVAVGNVIGSNIFNILLILGLAALVTPLVVSSQLVRTDVPLMILASLTLWWFSFDLLITRWEGVVLFASLLAYIVFCIRQSRKANRETIHEFTQELPGLTKANSSRWFQIGLIVAGLFLLGFGSKWLVDGAVLVATAWGVSELIIGLTIVAIGTSLPEVVTSVVASIRGERDIAVGNVVGSNLFNILCVLGLSSSIAPHGIPVSPEAFSFDLPVMVAVAVICLPIFFNGNIITRLEGGILLFYYFAYTALIILAETNREYSQWFAWILGYIVLPLTLLTIFGSSFWSWHIARRTQDPMHES